MVQLDLSPALSDRARGSLADMAATNDPHAVVLADHINARSWGTSHESDDTQLLNTLAAISTWCEYLSLRLEKESKPVLKTSDDRMVKSLKQTVSERFPAGVYVVYVDPAIGAGQSIRRFSGARISAKDCLTSFGIMRSGGTEGQMFLFDNARNAWMFARSSGKAVRPKACYMVLQVPMGESTLDVLREVTKKTKKRTKKRFVKKKRRSDSAADYPVEEVARARRVKKKKRTDPDEWEDELDDL